MNEYVNYKKYVTRQEGLNEAEFAAFPKKDEYTGQDSTEPQISPTARPTPIIGVSIRGSSTGGLPSGADQQGDISPTKIGGYDRVQPQRLNSKIVDSTPKNAEIGQENTPINNNPSTGNGVTHPHQIQVTAHEEPQALTGASTDSDPTLKLKSASPKSIDVDIAEKDGPEGENETDTMQSKPENQLIPATSLSEGKHKAGCKCGFCMNKNRFGKKKDDEKETKEPAEEEKKDEKSLDETFKRHMVLMKEYMAKKCPCGCEPDKCKCPSDCPKCDCNKEKEVKECATCGCGDPDNKHGLDHEEEEKKEKKELNESYSAPFSRMRSMAGLGNTVLLSNGLMETKHQPGADHPFTTHWKMDKEKAGYVKVDEEKLNKVKAMLERKSKRGSLSETEFKLAKRLEEVLKLRQSKK